VVNLFLLGFLSAHPIDRAWWIGACEGTSITACLLIIPGRLAVPYCPDPHLAAQIGQALRRGSPPTLLVGPRSACDQIWDAWGRPAPAVRWHDQRLYVARTPTAGARVDGLRPAREDQWEAVAHHAAEMEHEDLGVNPLDADRSMHLASVKERLRDRRTWVVERRGQIVFQINIGTTTPWGCQLGGTWVPPEHRGQGIATAAMIDLTRRLLEDYPLVTLHVNEANRPAVRVYEKAGYLRSAPYRLATLARPTAVSSKRAPP